jgi:hypothetical protein
MRRSQDASFNTTVFRTIRLIRVFRLLKVSRYLSFMHVRSLNEAKSVNLTVVDIFSFLMCTRVVFDVVLLKTAFTH